MTTRAEISEWFDEGVRAGGAYLIVVCDTFDHEDYPVYVRPNDDVRERFAQFNGPNMQKVMEVYDLTGDKAVQLAETRAWHLPSEAS